MDPGPAPSTPGVLPGEEATLLASREILPGRHLQEWRVPGISRRVQPGQFLYLTAPRPPGLLLPAIPVAGFDRLAGSVRLLLDAGAAAGAIDGLIGLRVGDHATFDGPFGQAFDIDPRSRFVLIVADVSGYARIRACVDEAVASGRRVTLILGARRVAEVPPSSLLPDEVEYVVTTEDGSLGQQGRASDLVTAYEAWADQCVAAGSPVLVDRLLQLAGGRDERMGVARLGRRRGRPPRAGRAAARRRAWLQVALVHDIGCALGVCLGCVIDGTDGARRVCREGPVFAAADLRPGDSR